MRFLFFLFLSINAFGQPKEINEIVYEYNKKEVLIAILQLEKTSLFDKELMVLEFDSTLNLYLLPEDKEIDVFLKSIQQRLSTVKNNKDTIILENIYLVVKLNVLVKTLNKTFNYEKEDPTIEALYLSDKTKFLFEKYIIDPKIQDWNSLSSFESNSLYKDFVNYFINQTKNKQKDILKSLVAILLSGKLT